MEVGVGGWLPVVGQVGQHFGSHKGAVEVGGIGSLSLVGVEWEGVGER